MSFNIFFASISIFPNEAITPLLIIFSATFNLFVTPSPNNKLPSFFRKSVVTFIFFSEPITLFEPLFDMFLAVIFKSPLLVILLLLFKLPVNFRLIFPSFSKFPLFSNDLVLIFKVSFAVYLPSKFKSLEVVISIFLTAWILPLLFLILEVFIFTFEELIFPFILLKNFSTITSCAIILLEFVNLSAFKFPLTLILPLFIKFWFDIFLAVIFPLLKFSIAVRLPARIFPLLSNFFVFIETAFIFPTDDILFCASKNPAFTFAVSFLLFKSWTSSLFFIVIFPVFSIDFVFNSKPSIIPELFKLLSTFKFPLTYTSLEFFKLFEDRLLLIISPEFINSCVLIFLEEISPLLDISFVEILSVIIFPFEFILFFTFKVFPWTTDVFVKSSEVIWFPASNFPLFVIDWEFISFIVIIFPLLSILFVVRFLADIWPEFFKSLEIDISLFVEIKFELSIFPFILISLLACICPEFFVFLLSILIAFSATSLSPISVSVDDIFISPFAWVSFKYTLPFDEITTSPFVA